VLPPLIAVPLDSGVKTGVQRRNNGRPERGDRRNGAPVTIVSKNPLFRVPVPGHGARWLGVLIG
jgi:hypothetical protein